MADHHYDIMIVGAGIVGMSAALALSARYKVALLEARPVNTQAQDERGLSLSISSQRILQKFNIWQAITAHPIKQVHVSHQGRFGCLRLNAKDIDQAALGFVVPAYQLAAALEQAIEHANIDCLRPAQLQNFYRDDKSMIVQVKMNDQLLNYKTKLLIGADGSQSIVRRLAGISSRQKSYHQTAIISRIVSQNPKPHIAYERFTRHGPIALLPVDQKHAVMVFTVQAHEANYYQQLEDDAYCQVIEQQFGRRHGSVLSFGQRHVHPLKQIIATRQHQPRLLLLGNAVHTIHPNAAQGLNLALRDVAGLADIFNTKHLDNPDLLASYVASRQSDQDQVVRFCDLLTRCFYGESQLLSHSAYLSSISLGMVPTIKKHFIRCATGIAGYQPAMIRAI